MYVCIYVCMYASALNQETMTHAITVGTHPKHWHIWDQPFCREVLSSGVIEKGPQSVSSIGMCSYILCSLFGVPVIGGSTVYWLKLPVGSQHPAGPRCELSSCGSRSQRHRIVSAVPAEPWWYSQPTGAPPHTTLCGTQTERGKNSITLKKEECPSTA